MPAVTFPRRYIAYQESARRQQMKNCELAEFTSCARAMEQVLATCGSALNSALRLGYFEPPVRSRAGSRVGS
jgi:hypothetical protein